MPKRRRSFLRDVVTLLGGAAALALPFQSKADIREIEFSDNDADKASKGYRETKHVRTYYEKARF